MFPNASVFWTFQIWSYSKHSKYLLCQNTFPPSYLLLVVDIILTIHSCREIQNSFLKCAQHFLHMEETNKDNLGTLGAQTDILVVVSHVSLQSNCRVFSTSRIISSLKDGPVFLLKEVRKETLEQHSAGSYHGCLLNTSGIFHLFTNLMEQRGYSTTVEDKQHVTTSLNTRLTSCLWLSALIGSSWICQSLKTPHKYEVSCLKSFSLQMKHLLTEVSIRQTGVNCTCVGDYFQWRINSHVLHRWVFVVECVCVCVCVCVWVIDVFFMKLRGGRHIRLKYTHLVVSSCSVGLGEHEIEGQEEKHHQSSSK